MKKNKIKSEETKKKMLDRINKAKNVKVFINSLDSQHLISNSIINLLENFDSHQEVGKKLNDEEIKIVEQSLGLDLPESYQIFLKYFGDGGNWIFFQAMDSIQNHSWLTDYRKDLGETIQLEEKPINVDSLLCLMTEDSNGGAWCWLASEKVDDNEWPLAYYSIQDKKLHYRVENFTEWLKILVKTKDEVIFELDKEEKLGLG